MISKWNNFVKSSKHFQFQSSSMVERSAVNRNVEGSSPSSGAIFIRCQQTRDAEERHINCK